MASPLASWALNISLSLCVGGVRPRKGLWTVFRCLAALLRGHCYRQPILPFWLLDTVLRHPKLQLR